MMQLTLCFSDIIRFLSRIISRVLCTNGNTYLLFFHLRSMLLKHSEWRASTWQFYLKVCRIKQGSPAHTKVMAELYNSDSLLQVSVIYLKKHLKKSQEASLENSLEIFQLKFLKESLEVYLENLPEELQLKSYSNSESNICRNHQRNSRINPSNLQRNPC